VCFYVNKCLTKLAAFEGNRLPETQSCGAGTQASLDDWGQDQKLLDGGGVEAGARFRFDSPSWWDKQVLQIIQ